METIPLQQGPDQIIYGNTGYPSLVNSKAIIHKVDHKWFIHSGQIHRDTRIHWNMGSTEMETAFYNSPQMVGHKQFPSKGYIMGVHPFRGLFTRKIWVVNSSPTQGCIHQNWVENSPPT